MLVSAVKGANSDIEECEVSRGICRWSASYRMRIIRREGIWGHRCTRMDTDRKQIYVLSACIGVHLWQKVVLV